MSALTPPPHISRLLDLAREAGQAIMKIYASDFKVERKGDSSPVTLADETAEKLILAGLAASWPAIPVIAEESVSAGRIPDIAGHEFFLVDPLDGTREFIARNGEFTVNIARIVDCKPQQGVIFAPALGKYWWGDCAVAAGAATLPADQTLAAVSWHPCTVRKLPSDGAVVVASRSHRDAETNAYLDTVAVKSIAGAGSSLKFCLVAAGEADLYPRFGRTMEWDTAAGHAILSAAGGKVVTTDGNPLAYGKAAAGFANPAFIASA